MYSLCKTTHHATGVELSLYCHFFNKTEKSLIVTGANVIRIFRLVPDLPHRIIGKPETLEGLFEIFSVYTIHVTDNECDRFFILTDL